MKPGTVIYDMPSEEYRDAAGLSHSDSKRLRKSPHHFHAIAQGPVAPKQPSPQMAQGQMVHAACLEPHTFDARYAVGPDISKNSNAWRTFASECEARGAEPISQLQRDVAWAIAASARQAADFAPIVEHCATEVSMWWECPATGILCKGRPDVIRRYPPTTQYPDGYAILADLKTTEDASAEGFARSVADYSYHTQAHWYCEGVQLALGVPVLSFLFVVVEREFPYACATYTLDDNAMTVAADINTQARALYAQCVRDERWPGYPSDTRDIALPAWYMKRYLQGLPV